MNCLSDRPNFQLDCTVKDYKEKPSYNFYNSLKDKHLKGYYNESRRNLLLSNNIISNEGIIIKNKIFYKAEQIVENQQQQKLIKNILIRKLKTPQSNIKINTYCPNIEKNKTLVRNLSTQVQNAKKILFDQSPTSMMTQSNGFKTLHSFNKLQKCETISNFQNQKEIPLFVKRQFGL